MKIEDLLGFYFMFFVRIEYPFFFNTDNCFEMSALRQYLSMPHANFIPIDYNIGKFVIYDLGRR